MHYWLFYLFAGLIGAFFGWWLCSLFAMGKIADLEAGVHTLVQENEHWARERRKEGAMG